MGLPETRKDYRNIAKATLTLELEMKNAKLETSKGGKEIAPEERAALYAALVRFSVAAFDLCGASPAQQKELQDLFTTVTTPPIVVEPLPEV